MQRKKCLANHRPKVFLYRCDTFKDQQGAVDSVARIVNQKSGKCLAMHANGHTFTHPCSGYRDQKWGSNNVREGSQVVNLERGLCLAAHDNGHVFGFRCTNSYRDQQWRYA